MSAAEEEEPPLWAQTATGTPRFTCPACSADLRPEKTPRDSIVLCATCCTPLLWDGSIAIATRAQLEGLPIKDRAQLEKLATEQRALLRWLRGLSS